MEKERKACPSTNGHLFFTAAAWLRLTHPANKGKRTVRKLKITEFGRRTTQNKEVHNDSVSVNSSIRKQYMSVLGNEKEHRHFKSGKRDS
jgi:hypothetical protein